LKDFGRRPFVLEDSQGRGGFDIGGGAHTSNAPICRTQDFLVSRRISAGISVAEGIVGR